MSDYIQPLIIAAREIKADGILSDPDDDTILLAAADNAITADGRYGWPGDLTRLSPEDRQRIIDAYDRQTIED